MSVCAACHAPQTRLFYELEQIPVQSCVLLDDAEAARAFGRGDLSLVACETCGFIGNSSFSAEVQGEIEAYETSQAHSPRFVQFMEELYGWLMDGHGLRGQHIIEIGAGGGDFLRGICAAGGNRGTGFDPTYRGEESIDGTRYVRALYDEVNFGLAADWMICRHTLEHIAQPLEFMRMMRRACDANGARHIFIEVPDTGRVLSECAFWDVYYEHNSYFTPDSLRSLLTRAGFEIEELKLAYDDQYLLVIAKPTERPEPGSGAFDPVAVRETLAACASFQSTLSALRTQWHERIEGWRAQGKAIAVWGSGSKAAGFLATLGVREEIPYIVDINPLKQGKFQAGTGQQIVAPDFLKEYRPDVVIVMNPVYLGEIGKMLQDLGLHPELLAA